MGYQCFKWHLHCLYCALGHLIFYCSSLSWQSLCADSSWTSLCVLWADETVNENCCGSLNKELPWFCLIKIQRDLAHEPAALIMDYCLFRDSRRIEQLIILNVELHLVETALHLLFLCRHHACKREPTMAPHQCLSTLCGQQLKSVVEQRNSLVWRSLHGKKMLLNKELWAQRTLSSVKS